MALHWFEEYVSSFCLSGVFFLGGGGGFVSRGVTGDRFPVDN